jgi:hypothetical protein
MYDRSGSLSVGKCLPTLADLSFQGGHSRISKELLGYPGRLLIRRWVTVIPPFLNRLTVQSEPVQFVRLEPDKAMFLVWDEAISAATEEFVQRRHSLFCRNCHAFVSSCLSNMQYDSSARWTSVDVVVCLFFRGKYVSFPRLMINWVPCMLLLFFWWGLLLHLILSS